MFSGRRTIHPGGRVLRRSSQSPRLQRRASGGVSGALERGWRPVGWTTSQHWACTLVLCAPSVVCSQPPHSARTWGSSNWRLWQGRGDPLGTSTPLRWSNCRTLFPSSLCSRSSPCFPGHLWREGLRCLQGPDPGVPTDHGPWDEELLPDSHEFMLGLPPPLWSLPWDGGSEV